MRKTRKVVKQKQSKRNQFRQKHKSKRLGRGKEDMVPVWIRKKLNDVHVRTYGQEFADNDLGITSNLLNYLPRASVTQAIKEDITKKHTTDLINRKLRQHTQGLHATPLHHITNSILEKLPADSIKESVVRLKIIKKNKERMLMIRTNFARIVNRMTLVAIAKEAINKIIEQFKHTNDAKLIDNMLDDVENTRKLLYTMEPNDYEDNTFEEPRFDENIIELHELLPKVFSDRYASIFPTTLLKEINKSVYTGSHRRTWEPDEVLPDFGGSKRRRH